MIFQLNVVHNRPNKLPQKSLYEKSLLFSVQAHSKSSKRDRFGALGVPSRQIIFKRLNSFLIASSVAQDNQIPPAPKT